MNQHFIRVQHMIKLGMLSLLQQRQSRRQRQLEALQLVQLQQQRELLRQVMTVQLPRPAPCRPAVLQGCLAPLALRL